MVPLVPEEMGRLCPCKLVDGFDLSQGYSEDVIQSMSKVRKEDLGWLVQEHIQLNIILYGKTPDDISSAQGDNAGREL